MQWADGSIHPLCTHPFGARLSGAKHHVHTGVVLLVPRSEEAAAVPLGSHDSVDEDWLVRSFACTTEVEFDALSNDTIEAYVKSGEPFGKAGAYGIQGLAGSFVRGINGCFYSVVGFPVHEFSKQVGPPRGHAVASRACVYGC